MISNILMKRLKNRDYVNFVMLDCYSKDYPSFDKEKVFEKISHDYTAVLCLSTNNENAVQSVRRMFLELKRKKY